MHLTLWEIMMNSKLIAVGAEAVVYEDTMFDKKVIIKKRQAKEYRNKILDIKIRKTRNKEEAILLRKVKDIHLNTPAIFYIGTDKIIMEKIIDSKEHAQLLKDIGENIAKLHNNNIIHGDLNLINIMTNKRNIYFIDFGLGFISNKIEDKATDLLVFKKTLLSSKATEGYWQDILDGYKKNTSDKEIIVQIGAIEKRGRYL
jgi:Kae1-associated kinase Bud32